ncbi:MAG: phosphoglycerate dehydrogenase [Gammaproteobacteria bacterium]|nr:phosphoglycerate dehydrogenase [Gammaproteobacteria bacterium]
MSRKKVFVADSIADEGVQYLRAQPDIEVDFAPGLDAAAVAARMTDVQALIVRSAVKVTAGIIAAGGSLRVIGRAGIGVDNIDTEAATDHGVVVMNTPDANATTTAELAVAHLLSLSRHLQRADASVRAGEWKRSAFVGAEVSGKTVGIVGYGTIGRIVAVRCQGLKMRVVAYDPFVTREMFVNDGVEAIELDALLTQADYVTIHCPLNDKTRNLIDAAQLETMKPDARIINCARGGIVNEQALYDALAAGRIAGAALDVFEVEPPKGSPLLGLANVVFTPHIGASTAEAQVAVGVEIAKQVVTYLRTGEPINAVNLPPISSETLRRLRPYQELAHRLGRLLDLMLPQPIEHVELSLHGRAAELDSHPLVAEAMVGLLGTRLSSPVNRVNALHVARRQGIGITESRTEETHGYVTLIKLSARANGEQVSLAGTLFDERHPRLVRINDYEIEAFLEGNLLLTRHADQPGVIGALGGILGDEKVNISRMQLGMVPGSDKAVAVLEISRPLPEPVLARIAALPAVGKVGQISL